VIVTLSNYQWNSVRARLDEFHVEQMARHRVHSGRSRFDYLLPAIGWRQVLDRLVEVSFGPLGGKQQSQPKSLYSAIRTISGAVMRMEGHPALRWRGVMGISAEVIPAWRTGVIAACTPYPQDNAEFVVLWPYQVETAGWTVTAWRPTPGSSDAEQLTYCEDFHLLFGRHVVADLDA
jgi:hypothetical protein